jgi:hypothetical protein
MIYATLVTVVSFRMYVQIWDGFRMRIFVGLLRNSVGGWSGTGPRIRSRGVDEHPFVGTVKATPTIPSVYRTRAVIVNFWNLCVVGVRLTLEEAEAGTAEAGTAEAGTAEAGTAEAASPLSLPISVRLLTTQGV